MSDTHAFASKIDRTLWNWVYDFGLSEI